MSNPSGGDTIASVRGAVLLPSTRKRGMLLVAAAAFLVPVALALIVFPTAMIDTRELFAWGRFFPLATHKHPPMMAWIGGLVELVLPATAAMAILAGQFLNAVGVAYLYATLRLIVDRERAAFFAFLFATSLYFQLAPLSYALNADILQVPERWKGMQIVTPRFVREAHRRNLPVQVWTVDDPDDMRRLLSWGVDGIQSDRPDLLARILHEDFGRPPPPGLRDGDGSP